MLSLISPEDEEFMPHISFQPAEVLILVLIVFLLFGRKVIVINNNNVSRSWMLPWLTNMVIFALLLGAGIWIYNRSDFEPYEQKEHPEVRPRWDRGLFD